MGDMGGDGGAVAHWLGGLGGANLRQRLEEGGAFVEVGALYALEGFSEQEAEAVSDFRDGDLIGHGLLLNFESNECR